MKEYLKIDPSSLIKFISYRWFILPCLGVASLVTVLLIFASSLAYLAECDAFEKEFGYATRFPKEERRQKEKEQKEAAEAQAKREREIAEQKAAEQKKIEAEEKKKKEAEEKKRAEEEMKKIDAKKKPAEAKPADAKTDAPAQENGDVPAVPAMTEPAIDFSTL